MQGMLGLKSKVGKREMLKQLEAMPEGGRAGVIWLWSGGKSGHTVVCEKINGKLNFIDPQSGKIDIALPDKVYNVTGYSFYRMDNLEVRNDFDLGLFVKDKKNDGK